jgi:hypothetical protein
VVFYDGRSPWTAALNFTGRTVMHEAFRRYIPSFEYCLVDLNRYRIEDLLRFKDELAALMLIDKVDFRDKGELLQRFPQYLEEMALKIPESLTTLMTEVIQVLLERLEVPAEEIRGVTELISEKGVGRMFDQFVEGYIESKRLAREEGILIGMEKGVLVGRKEGREEGVLVGMEKGREEGVLVGREEEREKVYQDKLEIAKKLLKRCWTIEETAETVELDIETVRKLGKD